MDGSRSQALDDHHRRDIQRLRRHTRPGTTLASYDISGDALEWHASTFLNMIGDEVRRGGRFDHGTVTGEFTSDASPVVFIRAEDTERLTAVAEVYGRADALQMVWPDSTGRLPWQSGYRNPPEAQPPLLLRTPPDE